MNDIHKLFQKLESYRDQPDIPLEVDKRISEALSTIEEDLYYIDKEDGYKKHVQDELKTLSESTKTVCDCSNYLCPPKRGNLPNRMRYVDSSDFEHVLEEYQMEHGNPEWVSDVRESWINRRKRVKSTLEDSIRAARSQSTEPLEKY